MKKILYTFFLLGGLMLFASASFAQTGTYTLSASDSFGDGWQGGSIEVTTISNGTVTIPGPATFGPDLFTFDLIDGESVMLCEITTDGFPNEISWFVTGPTGAMVVNVAQGEFTGSSCFALSGTPLPVVCNPETQCQLDVVLTMELVGTDFGDGWEGSTLDVTVNGQTNAINTIFGGETTVQAFDAVCLDFGASTPVDVNFVDNSGFDDDEIGWTIAFNGDNFEVEDLMNLQVNPGGGATNQGDISSSGTITVTCPFPTPTPAPNVSCGIYEVGKIGFLQAPAAIAECSNGFNCDVVNVACLSDFTETAPGVESFATAPAANGFAGSFAPFAIPVGSAAAPTFLGITVELCATGDFDFTTEAVDFLVGGNVIGTIGNTGNQCNLENCITVTSCGGGMAGGDLTIDFVDQNANAGFCVPTFSAEPTFLFGPASDSADAFACITWYASEDATMPLFVGPTLPISVIQDQINNGSLPASLLCHEQIATFFVTTSCGLTESDRFPVNLFVFEPCVSGCAQYVELTDNGGNGWGSASLDVSVNEGPAQELKLTTIEGSCSVTQFCVTDGGSLDLQYHENGADLEHTYSVINSNGVAFASGNGPTTDAVNVKADCPTENCAGELINVTARITFGTAADVMSWEIYDGFDNVNCQGPQVVGVNANTYAGQPAGAQDIVSFQMEACNEYTIALFDGRNISWVGGGTFELISADVDYGTEITNPNDPFFGQSIIATLNGGDFAAPGAEARQSITLSCKPECVDAVSDVILGDCFAVATVLPIAAPEVCIECNHAIGCNIQVRHTILNDANDGAIAFQGAFTPIGNLTEIDYTATAGFQMSAGCHSYVTEYLYCDGVVTKCTSTYTVVPAQTSNFACNDNVNIGLVPPDGNPLNGGDITAQNDDLGECVLQVTADLLIEGGVGSPVNINCEFFNINDFYEVIILDANDQPLVTFSDRGFPLDSNGAEILPGSNTQPANNFISYNEIKQTLRYVITHKTTGTTCWGELTVEDKNAPTITTTGYDVNCNDPNALDEFFSETITLQSSAASELPANIHSGQAGAGRSNTWIPFTVPCGRLGTSIQDIQISLSLTHNDPTDLAVELHIPTAFNNTLAAPFAGDMLLLDAQGDVGAVNTYTPNPINDSPDLLGLLGAACNEFSSEKDITFISETTGNTTPQGLGKTWYVNVTDNGSTAVIPPPGVGEVTAISMSITCGYPFPFAAFDCALDNVELVSEVITDNCALLAEWNGAVITRVWRATDACGNAANATQVVNLKAPRIADLILPSADIAIECGDEQLLADGSIDPAQTGGPAFNCDEVTDEDFCKLSISFTDNVIESCGNSLKIFRTWEIFNWCNPTAPTQLNQIIVVGDTTPPVIAAGATINVAADNNCAGSVDLSTLQITDGCSEITNVRFEYTTGSVYLGTGATQIIDLLAGETVEGLPMGETSGVVIATDECGNTSQTDVTINVTDNAGPFAICDDGLNVALGSNGSARVTAVAFDEGSSDNCSDVTLQIRANGAFAEFVDLDCSDLGTTRLELLVTDAAGNTAICWADILVEDVTGPSIVCKPNATVTCDEALHLDDVFADADATDNCGASVTASDIITVDLPNCGQLLTRTYTATDGSDKTDDVSCTQTITVEHVSDFIVQFPADADFDNCELGAVGEPIITDGDCEMISISSEDRVFTQTANACYLIERTWTVINQCIVDNPGDGGFTDLGTPLPIPRTFRDDDGYFQFVQIITVNDEVAPTVAFTAPDPCDFTAGCEGMVTLTATGEDDCSEFADLSFSWKIDAFSTGTFELEGTGADATGTYPYGDHIIKWTVIDGCGNVTSQEYDFSVQDCKNPTPIADGLATVVMNDGNCVEITAAHLLKKADDNCTVRTDEEWQANARVRVEGSNGALAATIQVCCADVQNGGVNVEVWVSDEAGNSDFVLVFVEVQDNQGNCPTNGTGSSQLAGRTATETGNNVDQVAVSINGDVVMTNANGEYSTVETTDEMYNVTPEKLDGFQKDLSTLDIVYMAQHILQINSLTTPYQLIAADVDADGDVDIFDMVELRQVVLFAITEGFTNNTAWRFVDASYTFQNPTSPWAESYPQYIDANLAGDLMNEDFVAVKIGDLDGSAATPFNSLEERSFPTTLTMNIDDVEMTAGNEYKVDFRASDFNDITGFQFTMNFDQNAADFISVEAGALNVNESNFGFTMLDRGIITTSFAQMGNGISVNNDEVLFSINFTANANATLHNVLSLTNQFTLAEAYNTESEVSDVKIAFNNAGLITTTGGNFELFQNKPNPFNESTLIGFNLPEASTATLRVYDVSGKNLKVITLNAARGYNEVNINRNELGAAGVLYYQLDTDADSAVKKMIILE